MYPLPVRHSRLDPHRLNLALLRWQGAPASGAWVNLNFGTACYCTSLHSPLYRYGRAMDPLGVSRSPCIVRRVSFAVYRSPFGLCPQASYCTDEEVKEEGGRRCWTCSKQSTLTRPYQTRASRGHAAGWSFGNIGSLERACSSLK